MKPSHKEDQMRISKSSFSPDEPKSKILRGLLWGPIDPICTNCIGKGWAQYPVPYVQTALERAGPNTQSEDKRVSEDDQ